MSFRLLCRRIPTTALLRVKASTGCPSIRSCARPATTLYRSQYHNLRNLPSAHTLRGSLKPSAAILLIAFVVLDYTVILYIQSQTQHSGGSEHRHREAQEPDLPIAEELNWTMVGAIQPGRPGNLTVEQEVKLQELWKATLKVFGVSIEDGPEPSEIAEAEEKEENGTAVTSEKKKKKKGLFSRKKTEKVDGEEKGKGKSATTEDKYGQLKEFQTALSNMPAEELRAAFWSMVKHDNPDALLLRFLRARKWDVEKALVMMISTMHWRAKEMYVEDDVMIKGEEAALKDTSSSDAAVKKEGDGFLAQLRLGKSFLHGVDKEGRPMCIVRVRLHKAGEQSEKSLERYTVHVLETARLLINPPIDTASIVFDMTGFTLANMDYTPVKFMIKCFEANYPESLGVVLVHNAPLIFRGIWTMIKGWLDPVVAGKINFTSTLEELERYIAKDHIISDLGGSDPFTYTYLEPIPGENPKLSDDSTRKRLLDERAEDVKEFEIATIGWLKFSGEEKDSGSVKEKRSDIAERLRRGYWELDPYVRARSYYDRVGMINEGGRVEFYPKDAVGNGALDAKASEKVKDGAAGTVPAKPDGPKPAEHNPDDLD